MVPRHRPGARLSRNLSAGAERAGLGNRTDDALAAAKLALVGIDRSLDALAEMAAHDEDARLEFIRKYLRRLRREVERRFPDARAWVRPGLDVPGIGIRTEA